MKAHFEINLVPLTINITQNFYKKIMVFCFPEKAIQDEAALLKQKESKQVGAFNLLYLLHVEPFRRGSDNTVYIAQCAKSLY